MGFFNATPDQKANVAFQRNWQ